MNRGLHIKAHRPLTKLLSRFIHRASLTMNFNIVQASEPNVYEWRLPDANGGPDRILLLELVTPGNELPFQRLATVDDAAIDHAGHNHNHNQQLAFGLMTLAKTYKVKDIVFFSNESLRDATDKSLIDEVYGSCKFAHNYALLVKFYHHHNVDVTPLTVLRVAQMLFACRGQKRVSKSQGQDLDNLQLEHVMESKRETQRILLWELAAAPRPFHCKYFALKRSDNSYICGPAMESLRSCLEHKSVSPLGPFLRRINTTTNVYPVHMPLLGQIEFPKGRNPNEQKALTILEFAASVQHANLGQEAMDEIRDIIDDDRDIDQMIPGSVGFAASYSYFFLCFEMGDQGANITALELAATAGTLLHTYEGFLRRFENNQDAPHLLEHVCLFAGASFLSITNLFANRP